MGLLTWRFLAFLGVSLAFASVAHGRPGHHYVNYRVSAYSGACDGQTTNTKDGHGVYYGEVASNTIPMGSLLRFDRLVRPPGHKPRRYFRVRDTGGGNMDNGLDLYLNDCDSMDEWGVRYLDFRVVKSRR